MNTIFLFIFPLITTTVEMTQSASSLETKYAELEKKFEGLLQNFTDLRTEMVSAEVLKLYLNQEISTRNRLEKQMEGLTNMVQQLSTNISQNMSVLQVLYEDDLQQIYEVKKTQSTLQDEVRRIALDVTKERDELNKTVLNAVRAITQTTDALQINITHNRRDLDTFKANISNDVKKKTDALMLNISNTRTDLESFKANRSVVSFTVTKRYNTGSLISSQTVVYEIVLVNIGMGYDNTTGIFTAPLGGHYIFSWNSLTHRGTCYIYLFKNGEKSVIAAYGSDGSGDESGSVTVVISLTKGDQVWLHADSCIFFYGRPYTYFSGFKI